MDEKEISRQVMEVTKTSGFQTLVAELDEEIKTTAERLDDYTKQITEKADKGIDGQQAITKLVSITAYLKGLKYLSQLIDDHQTNVDK